MRQRLNGSELERKEKALTHLLQTILGPFLNWGVWETRKKAAPVPVQVAAPVRVAAPVQEPVHAPEIVSKTETAIQRERAEDWSPSWEPRSVKSPLPAPLRWPVEKLRAKRRAFREWSNAEWR